MQTTQSPAHRGKRRQLIIPKREDALAFAKGDILLSNKQDRESSNEQDREKDNAQPSKAVNEPIFARISSDVYEALLAALARGKVKKTGPRKLQTLVDEALREWLEKRGYLEQRAA